MISVHLERYKILLVISLLLILVFNVLVTASAQPNILLIVSEDNGPHLSCYGDQNIQTKALDRLAAEGILFTNGYTTQAGCSPARSSMLTGLYPHQNGQLGLATHNYSMSGPIPNVTNHLKGAGYRTGIIGKLHVNPESAFVFDFKWDSSEYSSFSHRDVRKVAEVAHDFMATDDQPFFLMVNYPDAHVPFIRQYRDIPQKPLEAEDISFSQVGLETDNLREHAADYYNSLRRLDIGVELLLEKLEDLSMTENTLVIYLSDHGPQFSRGKMTSYELGVKIPLVMKWPGKIEKGQISDELISIVDLLPTILEATNLPIPEDLLGQSLLSKGSDPVRDYLVTEYNVHYPHVYYPQRSIRDHRYKIIVNYRHEKENPLFQKYLDYGRDVSMNDIKNASKQVQDIFNRFRHPPHIELYDLKKDPYELNNLSAKNRFKKVKDKLLDQLRIWQVKTEDPLMDSKKLDLLSEEHDRLTNQTDNVWIVRDLNYKWKYPNYLFN